MEYRNEELSQIKERLYEKAAAIYGDFTQQELNRLEGFDPLVDMLLGACAYEFKKVSDEIQSSRARMLQRVAELLTPEVHTLARPASGIVHALPDGMEAETNPLQDIISANNRMYFSPSGRFMLHDAQVSVMASGSSLFSISDTLSKTEELRASTMQSLPPHDLWLGIGTQLAPQKIAALRLFFNWSKESMAARSKEILARASWWLSGQPVEFKLGTQPNSVAEFKTSRPLHPVRSLEKDTNALYDHLFVRLMNIDLTSDQTPCPAELAECFGEAELQSKCPEPLTWLKLELPEPLFKNRDEARQALRSLTCLTNCFPAVNRQLHTVQFALNDSINFFPLPASPFFLGVESVTSTHLEKHYQEKPFLEMDLGGKKKQPLAQTRTYAIRHQNVNRFNQTDARERVDNLLKFIREEAFVFSAMGKSAIQKNLKDIRKAVNDIESKLVNLRQGNGQLQSNLFIVFPPGEKENVIVQYWSTDGFKGNNLPPETALTPQGSSSLSANQLRFVQKTQGGHDPVANKDKVHRFKSALAVRDKIVTKEDIRIYCLNEIGGMVKKIDIQKSSRISPDVEEGYERVMNVNIQLVSEKVATNEQKHFLEKKLETGLNSHSSSILPIEVRLS